MPDPTPYAPEGSIVTLAGELPDGEWECRGVTNIDVWHRPPYYNPASIVEARRITVPVKTGQWRLDPSGLGHLVGLIAGGYVGLSYFGDDGKANGWTAELGRVEKWPEYPPDERATT